MNQTVLLPSAAVLILTLNLYAHVSNGATDTISPGRPLNVSETIVSAGGEFELGFFTPGNATFQFVGIWYRRVSVKTVVWVGNRDFPILPQSPSVSPSLSIASDKNLVIHDGRITYAVTNATVLPGANCSATLLDSGNLVLRDQSSGAVLWESFDYPSDTLLPGMKLGYSTRSGQTWSLRSWKSVEHPGPGSFSMRVDDSGSSQIFILQGMRIYWASGTWNGSRFSRVREDPSKYLSNITYVSDRNGSYFMYSGFGSSNATTRLVLDVSGMVKELRWSEESQVWVSNWSQPRQQCEVYAYCGGFGVCSQETDPFCQCISGFVPRSPKSWKLGDMSDGCMRKTLLECEKDGNATSDVQDTSDRFRLMTDVALPVNQLAVSTAGSDVSCKSVCLNNCSCTAYAYNSDGCFIWGEDLYNLQQLTVGDSDGKQLYIKYSGAEYRKAAIITKWWFWVVLVLGIILVLMCAFGVIFYIQQRSLQNTVGEDLLLYDFDTSNLDSTHSTDLGAGGKQEVQLPLFSFASVSEATDDFSVENKLGEGGFGPVYKGTLRNGYLVAVKRLSRKSGQGWDELRNEATLIAKLQHKNLVRLLGCCLERDEKMLIYEYLQNKSLDFFLFNPSKRHLLDWDTRIHIIKGIAQGLLYLHEHSRLRIIHRDLKASNILLDRDMTSKISDFGMARIFGGDDACTTNRIVGTYGYMSPEYAMDGLFSVKSDVFSFGILLLEILSGKKNTGLFTSNSPNLLGHAWNLWKRGDVLDLMDPVIGDKPSSVVQLRYLNVGLLCVQESAADRPAMPEVASMLSNESQIIPSPKLPCAIIRSLMDDDDSSSTRELTSFSRNELTDSMTYGR